MKKQSDLYLVDLIYYMEKIMRVLWTMFFTEDQKVDILLEFVKDPDDAEKLKTNKFDELPEFIIANLTR